MSTVLNSIKRVFGLSAPSEILRGVICKVTIKMSALMALGWLSVKGNRDKSVDIVRSVYPVLAQGYSKPSRAVSYGLNKHSTRPLPCSATTPPSHHILYPIDATYITVVRYFVEALMTRYAHPMIIHCHMVPQSCTGVKCHGK